MKILPRLLPGLLVLLLLSSLSACSTRSKNTAHQQGATDDIVATGVALSSEEEESSLAEPEATAEEEIAALSQPGAWEYGAGGRNGSLANAIDLSAYDFPITVNRQVQYYLDLFQGKQRNYFTGWLARSARYRPFIETELAKAGLPRDLVFLAMIESGFNPSAYSCADAAGLWQFIEGTGRRYGLQVNTWVDERRQPEKATRAAIKYLSKLHREFDDWYLAVAAYNAGERRIENAITDHGTRDFWEIAATDSIFQETKRYVPKLIAAIIIGRNPERYGFTDIEYFKPQQYELIDVPAGTDLGAVAAVANTSLKKIRALNNELIKNQTPPKQGNYTLRIPTGTRELIAGNLDKYQRARTAKLVATTRFLTHTVQRGETLSQICRDYNISTTTLLKANNLRSSRLQQGLRLRIPATATTLLALKKDEQPKALAGNDAANRRTTVLHQVRSGETLSRIASQYQVSVREIMQWNTITEKSKVRAGQRITLHLDRPAPEAMTVLATVAKAPVDGAEAPAKAIVSAAGKREARQGGVPVLTATKKQSAATAPAVATATRQAGTTPASQRVAKKQPAAPALVVAAGKKQAAVAVAAVTIPKAKKAAQTWYVVKNGDTLWNIAKRFQISPQEIKKLNNLPNNNLARGDKLLVKRG
jgi:membrane-bound lytic murein transglycosylase D